LQHFFLHLIDTQPVVYLKLTFPKNKCEKNGTAVALVRAALSLCASIILENGSLLKAHGSLLKAQG